MSTGREQVLPVVAELNPNPGAAAAVVAAAPNPGAVRAVTELTKEAQNVQSDTMALDTAYSIRLDLFTINRLLQHGKIVLEVVLTKLCADQALSFAENTYYK